MPRHPAQVASIVDLVRRQALFNSLVASCVRVNSLEAGLEKTRFLKKETQPSGFFRVLFFYICPEERVFRVFSVSRILLGASRL